jgi:hypothetical protein
MVIPYIYSTCWHMKLMFFECQHAHPHTLPIALPEISLAVDSHRPTPSIEEHHCVAKLRHLQSTSPLGEPPPRSCCPRDASSPLKLVPLILIRRRHQRAATSRVTARGWSAVTTWGALLWPWAEPRRFGPVRSLMLFKRFQFWKSFIQLNTSRNSYKLLNFIEMYTKIIKM